MQKLKTILLLLSISLTACAQNPFKTLSDSLAKAYLQNKPGSLVIGIFDNGRQKIFYYGETSKGNKQTPDSGSIFELGEITETFTSVLYAEMSVKGIVKMDEKLQDMLPVNVPAPVYHEIICKKADDASQLGQMQEQKANVKIDFTPYVCFPDPSSKPQYLILCDLATHTTGLPAYPSNLKKNKSNPYGGYQTEDLYTYLKNHNFSKPLGYDYEYSATGMALLGHALSLKMQTGFDTLLTDRILVPLKMTDTEIILSEQNKSRLVTGYNRKGREASPWVYDVLAPSGGLHSTPSDMMKFLSANLNKEKNDYVNILDYTHNARLRLTDKKEDTEIALGWKINSLGAEHNRVVWQQGSTGGYSAYIGFVETNHTGVFVLSSVSKNVDFIGLKILQKLSREKMND
ncbi:MAG: serine hydrolase [Bacteroidetes bacterium]|nr:serine hydrolase [Bacteroidota bacterium]